MYGTNVFINTMNGNFKRARTLDGNSLVHVLPRCSASVLTVRLTRQVIRGGRGGGGGARRGCRGGGWRQVKRRKGSLEGNRLWGEDLEWIDRKLSTQCSTIFNIDTMFRSSLHS